MAKTRRKTTTRPRKDEWSKPEKLIVLQGWAMDGLTIEQIAKNIRINKSTLYEWMKSKSDISNALKIGREEADQIVVNALFKNAKTGDTKACIFWLKNRQADKWNKDKLINYTNSNSNITNDIMEAIIESANQRTNTDIGK